MGPESLHFYKLPGDAAGPPGGREGEGIETAGSGRGERGQRDTAVEESQEQEKRDFPGGLVVKTVLLLRGAWVRSLVGELISHMPGGAAKKKKKITE